MQHSRPHARQRGVTLIEVLIVVAIMSLLASGIGFAAYKHYQDARIQTTQTTTRQLRQAVHAYWMARASTSCPSTQDLLDSGLLDEDASTADPWGSPWDIRCAGQRVTVRSAGPDSEQGTDDDIVAPRNAHPSD